jgi:uncharacterized protein DUF4012
MTSNSGSCCIETFSAAAQRSPTTDPSRQRRGTGPTGPIKHMHDRDELIQAGQTASAKCTSPAVRAFRMAYCSTFFGGQHSPQMGVRNTLAEHPMKRLCTWRGLRVAPKRIRRNYRFRTLTPAMEIVVSEIRNSTHRETTVQADPGAPSGTPRAAPTRLRRSLLVTSLALIAATGLFAISLAGVMRAVREDLLLGRSALERGRDELLAGDAGAAAMSFREGRRLFERAGDRTTGLVVRAAGWLPIVGRTVDAVDVVAASAVTAADATMVLAGAAAELPGGPAGLAPTRGVVPIDRIPPLARAAREADEMVTAALSQLEQAPTSLLIGPVGPARRDAEAELGELRESIHAASLLLRGLPTFLGSERPQRYFFGAQNPAELRGTGGLIGAFSILELDDGRFRFSPFAPIHSIAQPPLRSIPPPNEDYAANYNQFRRDGRFWTSINVMPDFPSVAQAILGSYETATGDGLDGVILADPFALQPLLEATGPVRLRRYGVEIDASNVVTFTTNEAYSLFSDPVQRKRVLGDAAQAAFTRFVAQPSPDYEDLTKLLEAASAGHIQIFSADPPMQEGLQLTPAGGVLRPAGAEGALLSVVVNSAAGSKVDFYQDRDIRYSVELGDDGSATAVFDLTLRNHAPTSGLPAYVIGPSRPAGQGIGPILRTLEAGESVALVNVYCGVDCVPGDAILGGSPVTAAFRADLGIRYFQHYYSIPSGEEETLRLSWDDPEAWEGNSSGGVYRMTFANQVTIRPATLSLRIEPPDGMRIASVSSPLEIVDGVAVYAGQPGARLDLAIEFRPPLPERLWENTTRFLETPLFEL